MSTEENVLHSLLNGLTKHDQISVLRSIQDTRDLQIEQKLHPRRRRQRNEDGVLEPLTDESPVPERPSVPEQSPSPDAVDVTEAWESPEPSE